MLLDGPIVKGPATPSRMRARALRCDRQRLHLPPEPAREVGNRHGHAPTGDGPAGELDEAAPRRGVINDAVRRHAAPNAVEVTKAHHEVHPAMTGAFRALAKPLPQRMREALSHLLRVG